jgi:hypothetical protein
MSHKKKYVPPEPLKKDIDPNNEVDCNELDKMISESINLASINVEKDLKEGFPIGTNVRFEGFLKKSLETHQVIRDIYRNYGKDYKPHQLCALPLARQQIELVFNLALLARKPDKWISIYERNTLINIYQRFLYEAEETKDLPRFKEGTEKRGKLIKSWMLGKGPVPIHQPFKEDDLRKIEESVKIGLSLKGLKFFPLPRRIISEITEDKNDPIIKVLFRLYIEYSWLSSYVHLSDWSLITRNVIIANHPQVDLEDFHQKEVRTPVVNRSYLGMLIAATDVSSYLKNPMDLRVKLIDAWELFEPIDFLFGFVWEKWAKSTLGLIDK